LRKLRLGLPIALLSIAVFCVSCGDPLYYYISQETPVENPKIPGSPTKLVKTDAGNLYVGNPSGIWQYSAANPGVWTGSSKPDGDNVVDIAAVGNYLYVLTDNAGSSAKTLWKNDMAAHPLSQAKWEKVSYSSGTLLSIHGANDTLFVGAYQSAGNYAVFSATTGDTSLSEVKSGFSKPLSAAAYFSGNYYISIQKGGIYFAPTVSDLDSVSAITDSAGVDGDFVAFTVVGSELIATTTYGTIWKIQSNGSCPAGKRKDYDAHFSSALAVYDSVRLLIGRTNGPGDSTTYLNYGYYELPISAGGVLNFAGNLEDTPSTVGNNVDAYNIGLGVEPLKSLQTGNDGKLFASTQLNGVWQLNDTLWEIVGEND
jgi:hypothetical protein